MPNVKFIAYLHDDYDTYERATDIVLQVRAAGSNISEAAIEKIGRPFYEVGLDCSIDTETGEVEIIGINRG